MNADQKWAAARNENDPAAVVLILLLLLLVIKFIIALLLVLVLGLYFPADFPGRTWEIPSGLGRFLDTVECAGRITPPKGSSMTREEAIKLLEGGREGVTEWNAWREKNEPLPDLRSAKLSEADLAQVNLRAANLCHTNLYHAKLFAADLRGADLTGSMLANAELAGASLDDANLHDAVLSGADLMDADLGGAKLSGARLFGTRFNNSGLSGTSFKLAQCFSTMFSDLDLSSAKDLESVEHMGPSTIGIDTIFLSGGKIPEKFLRGCGVPEEFIRYIPSLIGSMSPVQFYSCFISYSHKDGEFCRRLHSRLQQEGLRVWFAPEEMKGGKELLGQIESAIRLHDKLLVVLSEHSMKSDWVAKEIYRARQREKKEKRKVLFPIRVCSFEAIEGWRCLEPDSDRDMAVEVCKYFIPDFSNWKNHDDFEKAFARLLKDLRATETAA